MNSSVRPAAVAGLFYPGVPDVLRREVREMLDAAPVSDAAARVLIVPHAGYIYSGAVAAPAYNLLAPLSGRIRTVAILGPNHRVPLRGVAAVSCEAFATPLGEVPVDRRKVDALVSAGLAAQFDVAHAQEHCLEVHLPFLQEVLGEFQILPLLIGDMRADEVEALIARLLADEATALVVSSDLSHYLPYDTARAVDADTAARIVDLDGPLAPEQACGCRAINGLLAYARGHQLSARLVAAANSGDACGDKTRVVGYGTFAFEPVQSV